MEFERDQLREENTTLKESKTQLQTLQLQFEVRVQCYLDNCNNLISNIASFIGNEYTKSWLICRKVTTLYSHKLFLVV